MFLNRIAGTARFDEAQALCKHHGMRLLTIETKNEMDFISDILSKYNGIHGLLSHLMWHTNFILGKKFLKYRISGDAKFWTGSKCRGWNWYWDGDLSRPMNTNLVAPLSTRLEGDYTHAQGYLQCHYQRPSYKSGNLNPICEADLHKNCWKPPIQISID